jgi:anti-sigma regulatory factor (Ser/Thr protein kinase)
MSELARNIITYAGEGTVVVEEVDERGISIVAHDQGAGIACPSSIFVPGHGLWAVRQGVDDLIIETGDGGRGVRVTARKLLQPIRASSYHANRPL